MEMKNEALVNAVRALTDTAVEKLCVLGVAGAKADIDRLREVIDDLITFWDLEPHLLDDFDKRIEKVSRD